MKTTKLVLLGLSAVALSACVSTAPGGNQNREAGFFEINTADNTSDRELGVPNHLSNMRDAGIWVDPHGCDHWIIDEGIEGYMSARLDQYGNPVCSGIAPPTIAVGRYRRGT
ncbi:hypothetical protein [Pararhodobacter zhoushanensis]|uniref:hypothetical protein n=1 Tax=Pararhodobacter zhoushanensis TaxID=2479545 RepID=UPI000F8F6A68|nr:hypothetical protein [Pararhodobacter zhoushanensis]